MRLPRRTRSPNLTKPCPHIERAERVEKRKRLGQLNHKWLKFSAISCWFTGGRGCFSSSLRDGFRMLFFPRRRWWDGRRIARMLRGWTMIPYQTLTLKIEVRALVGEPTYFRTILMFGRMLDSLDILSELATIRSASFSFV